MIQTEGHQYYNVKAPQCKTLTITLSADFSWMPFIQLNFDPFVRNKGKKRTFMRIIYTAGLLLELCVSLNKA